MSGVSKLHTQTVRNSPRVAATPMTACHDWFISWSPCANAARRVSRRTKKTYKRRTHQRVPTGPVSLRRRATAPRGMGECREASPDSCGEAGTGRVDRRHPRVRNLPVRPPVPVGLRERFTCWAHIGAVGGRESTLSLGLPAARRLVKMHRNTSHSRHDICEVAD